MSKKATAEQLQKLLETYGDSEPTQSFADSATDNQLNSISLSLEEMIRQSKTGTVLDIGCGTGILLSKLTDIKAFMDNSGWMYVGTDFNELENILQLAVKFKVHRRCDVLQLDDFYRSWLESVDSAEPLLIFLRNVLHELDIPDTAKLLHLLISHMRKEDTLIIQDLLVFPQAERGNACWDSECLESVLNLTGFDLSAAIARTRSGSQWISIIIRKKESTAVPSLSTVQDNVATGRIAQLEKWRTLKKFPSDIRLNAIAQIDFDLQLSALYEQLNDSGYINARQQDETLRPDPRQAFQLALSMYDSAILARDRFSLPSLNNFRDRANSQDALELFLSNQDSVVVIQGSAACGKTVLVSHVLSRRAHERSVVSIDCASANDVWSILEQYLLGIGCLASFDILSQQKDLRFEHLYEILYEFIARISDKTIVVFDHFENLLDPNGKVMNADICDFLTLIASSHKAKLIFTTRREPVLDFFPVSVQIACDQPPVGRFPEGQHVENILDDYVDRTAIGLGEYPQELLKAIDRYPYLATLAGKLIAEAGVTVAHDPIILQIIRSYLYDELVKKIASPTAQQALDLACSLRIPTPASLYENIVGKEATAAAIETGILFSVPDRFRNDLLFCAAILRDATVSLDLNEGDADSDLDQKAIHARIAKCYEDLSHGASSDPRWIREAHYHYLASGDLSGLHKVGSMYMNELFWAGQIFFRKYHNYEEALEMLRAAEAMALTTYESRRLIASCLIRTGNRDIGTSCYDELIDDYPHYIGAKTSYIDSLLNIKAYADALNLLEGYGFNESNSTPWVLGQFGRAYMGLCDYPSAAHAFELQLKKATDSSSIVYVRLAQAYFRNGNSDKAQEAIQKGLRSRKDDPVLNALFYSNLIRDNSQENLSRANAQLNALLERHPRNGFILQKLVRVSSINGDISRVLAHLENINWQVRPQYLELPIRISVLISQNRHKQALDIAKQMSDSTEYAIPIIYSIYLSWASVEKNEKNKQSIAAMGVAHEISPELSSNIPVLTMYAHLARIAKNDERFEQTVLMIEANNPTIAAKLRDSENVDSGDFEPEMP